MTDIYKITNYETWPEAFRYVEGKDIADAFKAAFPERINSGELGIEKVQLDIVPNPNFFYYMEVSMWYSDWKNRIKLRKYSAKDITDDLRDGWDESGFEVTKNKSFNGRKADTLKVSFNKFGSTVTSVDVIICATSEDSEEALLAKAANDIQAKFEKQYQDELKEEVTKNGYTETYAANSILECTCGCKCHK